VTGFVRKLSDGRVELVASGTAESLESLHAAISKRFAGGADTENLGTHHAASSRNHVAGHPIKDRPSNATRGQAGEGYGLEPSVYY
jgi:acylphosphatase